MRVGLNQEQASALAQLLKYRDRADRGEVLILRLSGCAGSGKTFTSNELVKEVQKDYPQGLHLCAPTHQAKNQLKKRGWDSARTIHSHLGLRVCESEDGTTLEEGGKVPVIPNKGILLIDEAGMIARDVLDNLVGKIALAAREFSLLGFSLAIVLLYDTNQLKPVGEKDFPILDLGRKLEKEGLQVVEFEAFLKTPVRFQGTPSEAAINLLLDSVNETESPNLRSLAHFNSSQAPGSEFFYALGESAATKLCLAAFRQAWSAGRLHEYQAVAYTHKKRRFINRLVRQGIGLNEDFEPGENLVCISPLQRGDDIVRPTHTRLAVWSVGEERTLSIPGDDLPESYAIKYKNLETVETVEGQYLYSGGKFVVKAICPDSLNNWDKLISQSYRLKEKGDRPWLKHLALKKSLDSVEHAYACTTYAAQGMTIPYVFIPSTRDFERFENRAIYTAASRVSRGLCLGV